MNRNFIQSSAVMHLFSLTAAGICLSPLDPWLCGLYGPRISHLFYNSQRPQQQEGGRGKGIPLQATLQTWPLECLRLARKQTHKSKEVFSHLLNYQITLKINLFLSSFLKHYKYINIIVMNILQLCKQKHYIGLTHVNFSSH